MIGCMPPKANGSDGRWKAATTRIYIGAVSISLTCATYYLSGLGYNNILVRGAGHDKPFGASQILYVSLLRPTHGRYTPFFLLAISGLATIGNWSSRFKHLCWGDLDR